MLGMLCKVTSIPSKIIKNERGTNKQSAAGTTALHLAHRAAANSMFSHKLSNSSASIGSLDLALWQTVKWLLND